ncbi:hypothetical protein [Mixta mediterraneensis]
MHIELDALPHDTLLTAGTRCSLAIAGDSAAHVRLTALLANWL